MSVKLSLSINEEVATQIKSYAEKHNTSVSKIAEEQFIKLTQHNKSARKTFTQKYAGTMHTPIADIDEARDEYLKGKYGV